MRHFRNDRIGGNKEWVLDVDKDDRGRLVAEVWHTTSGKTLGTTEVESIKAAESWARKAIVDAGAAVR